MLNGGQEWQGKSTKKKKSRAETRCCVCVCECALLFLFSNLFVTCSASASTATAVFPILATRPPSSSFSRIIPFSLLSSPSLLASFPGATARASTSASTSGKEREACKGKKKEEEGKEVRHMHTTHGHRHTHTCMRSHSLSHTHAHTCMQDSQRMCPLDPKVTHTQSNACTWCTGVNVCLCGRREEEMRGPFCSPFRCAF